MRFAKRISAAAALLASSAGAMAHQGHGLNGSHWHATDAYGFAFVAALAVIAIWLSRGE